MNLEHLRKVLPNNWASLIAEKHGVSGAYVRMVFAGQRQNIEIADSIIELAARHKKKMQELQERAAAI